MARNYIVFISLSLLMACSGKSSDLFVDGEVAYDSGQFETAKTLFLQVDSLSPRKRQAIEYIRKIDSVLAVTKTPPPETITHEIAYDDENFTAQEIQLDTSQFQLIDITCVLFLEAPLERRERNERARAIYDSIQEATKSYDSNEHSADEEQDFNDDGMWYQYKYEEQFNTLKELGIPAVRVQQKPYVRFIDKNNKVWTLINKANVFYDDGMVLFRVGRKPMHLYLNDGGSEQIREYFNNK